MEHLLFHLLAGISLIIGSILFVLMNAASGPWWAAMSSFFIGVGMGLTTYFIYCNDSRSRTEKDAWICHCCEYVHAEFWKYGRSRIFWSNIKWFTVWRILKEGNLDFGLDDVNLLLTEETAAINS